MVMACVPVPRLNAHTFRSICHFPSSGAFRHRRLWNERVASRGAGVLAQTIHTLMIHVSASPARPSRNGTSNFARETETAWIGVGPRSSSVSPLDLAIMVG